MTKLNKQNNQVGEKKKKLKRLKKRERMPLDLGIFDNKKQSWFTGESSE